MSEASGESLEFCAVESNEQLHQFSRSSFRVRVSDREGFRLRFGSLNLRLADVGSGGISLVSDNTTAMALGDIICNCELTLDGEHFSGLNGRVVHQFLEAGHTITGIQWLDLSPALLARFQITLKHLRSHLFARD